MMAGRREQRARPGRGFRLPWLALAGVAATIVAAATLVAGIGDTLDGGGPPGRLLPLHAASPPLTPPPNDPGRAPSTPVAPPESPETRLHDALVRLRLSVSRGVDAGDVRGDVGLDLTKVIEQILDRPWTPLEHRRADVGRLHQRIAVRARQGTIAGRRADELHLILDRAT
ncbi:hypothetical protein [Actinomadura sp. 9N215]|uniref:hypothetical protein n=1 Tax=Actinomadura sp. 9N215 TaxID=3375150 RepID=UPI00378953EB